MDRTRRSGQDQSVELLDRLLTGRHGAITSQPFKAEKLAQISMQLRRLSEQPVFDLTNYSEVQRYAAARQQVARSLKEFAIALGNRDNANGAWRSRSLRRQSEAAVMRAQVALGAYNAAAQAYNRLVGSLSSSLAKALLYPGSRRFAVLEP